MSENQCRYRYIVSWDGTVQNIKDLLTQLEERLGTADGLFVFRKHVPKKPKTTLPLHTYYVDIPSVLTSAERNAGNEKIPHQELKVEFILQNETAEYEKRTGENIFAVDSRWEYQLLPLNQLFADKLTTMGSSTIGVQNDRMDEQVKQFYDILMLTRYCIGKMNYDAVRENYERLARTEWMTRTGRDYDREEVIADVRKQLFRYEMADSGEDSELKKSSMIFVLSISTAR